MTQPVLSDAPLDESLLRPLSARSIVLSLMLGAHPPEMSARHVVAAVELLGVSEASARVALTRLVSKGDLTRSGTTYRLTQRLVDRQRRQDEAISPRALAWRGQWELVTITATRRSPAARATLRGELAALRLAELREGLWLRPKNLRRVWPPHLGELAVRFTARPEQPDHALVRVLWDVEGWAATGHTLHAHFTRSTGALERLTLAAAIVRHLLADPVLPAALLPDDWPGDTLRAAYADYQADLVALIAGVRTS